MESLCHTVLNTKASCWMYQRLNTLPYICARCQRALSRHNGLRGHAGPSFSGTAFSPLQITKHRYDAEKRAELDEERKEEEGAMSRRLAEMSEQNLEEGGRSARKAVEEAGFDEELKQKLLNRIADANFRSENAQALSQANIPSSAGKATREIASATAWSGTESIEDATLRMLNDSYKPLRHIPRTTSPARPPKKVDTGRPKSKPSSGARLANARDRSSMYSYLRDDNLSDKERNEMRQELKARFQPGARSLPMTLQGLSSLANERIEDAIARGQFKNLPRGKKIERDYNMSSPFIDTTEYFMNKIIQKQDIVPPWIEKQQELVATANKFRSRLRNDWKRHAARLIASSGGSLQSQIARAEEYARAEAVVNPTKNKKEKLNTVDAEGHISQISLSGELQPPKEGETASSVQITVVEEPGAGGVQAEGITFPSVVLDGIEDTESSQSSDVRVSGGAVFPFRDSQWEQNERSYHVLAIDNLNSLTRSYNLMAPNLAKKPYFLLDRELRACYADVAPQLANEIRNRAMAPKVKIDIVTHTPGGVLERMGGGTAQVYDSQKPHYGFKEFWRDVFGTNQTVK